MYIENRCLQNIVENYRDRLMLQIDILKEQFEQLNENETVETNDIIEALNQLKFKLELIFTSLNNVKTEHLSLLGTLTARWVIYQEKYEEIKEKELT